MNTCAIDLKSLCDDGHVKTRICQHEPLTNGKELETAKQIVLAKVKGQDQLLRKYGLRWLDYYPYSQAVKSLSSSDLGSVRSIEL